MPKFHWFYRNNNVEILQNTRQLLKNGFSSFRLKIGLDSRHFFMMQGGMNMLKFFWKDSSEIPEELITRNFSLVHMMWFVALAIIVLVFLGLYKRQSEKTRDIIKKILAVVLVLCEVSVWIWKIIIGQYYLRYSLPLHLCGISVFIEFFAVFIKKSVTIKEFAYALSMPGALAALLTPDWRYPFFTFQYLELLLYHVILVLIPVLFVWGDGFKPDYKRLLKVSGLFILFIALAVTANRLFGGNYMFLASAPAGTTLELFVRWFGERGYLYPEFVLLLLVWTALYLPRIISGHQKRQLAAITADKEADHISK
jgi:hypothetical integral membrane protein (TIGR02206 family)